MGVSCSFRSLVNKTADNEIFGYCLHKRRLSERRFEQQLNVSFLESTKSKMRFCLDFTREHKFYCLEFGRVDVIARNDSNEFEMSEKKFDGITFCSLVSAISFGKLKKYIKTVWIIGGRICAIQLALCAYLFTCELLQFDNKYQTK